MLFQTEHESMLSVFLHNAKALIRSSFMFIKKGDKLELTNSDLKIYGNLFLFHFIFAWIVLFEKKNGNVSFAFHTLNKMCTQISQRKYFTFHKQPINRIMEHLLDMIPFFPEMCHVFCNIQSCSGLNVTQMCTYSSMLEFLYDVKSLKSGIP